MALVILIGAGASGKAGDRFGRLRVITVALWIYGAGFLVPIFTTSRPVIAACIPLIAIGGGTVMTLAYALLMPLMPEDEHGTLTGFYSLSRGIGIVAGPILAGVLIGLTATAPVRRDARLPGDVDRVRGRRVREHPVRARSCAAPWTGTPCSRRRDQRLGAGGAGTAPSSPALAFEHGEALGMGQQLDRAVREQPAVARLAHRAVRRGPGAGARS